MPAAKTPIRVWLDDDLVNRTAPPGWVHVRTAQEAIELLRTHIVLELSLDHDLGDDREHGTGYDVVLFLAEESEARGRDLWPRRSIAVHSANFSASHRMEGTIDRYSGMQRVLGGRRWERLSECCREGPEDLAQRRDPSLGQE